MKKGSVAEIISGVLIILFVYTAASKFADFAIFKSTLRLAPVVGKHNEFFAWAIPIVEITIAILLYLPSARLAGMYGSAGIMLLFTLYIGYLLYFRADNLPCSCGGVLKQLGWKEHLFFNLFFMLLSIAGILLQKRNKFLLQ